MGESASQTRAPSLFVIVLNWNGGDDTLACLESLERVRDEWTRCLLVDNGSTDGSLERARRRFAWAETIETGANLGYAGGNNVGIRRALEASADQIFILNNDALVNERAIATLSETLTSEPGAAMVGPLVYGRDGRGLQCAGGHVGFAPFRAAESREIPERASAVDYVPGCALLVRREVIESVGLLDDRFFILWEETEWAARMRAAGFRCLVEPGAAVRHLGSVTFAGNTSPLYSYYFLRNMLLFARLHAPAHQRRGAYRNSLGWARTTLRRGRRRGRGAPTALALAAAALHFAVRRYGRAPEVVERVSARSMR